MFERSEIFGMFGIKNVRISRIYRIGWIIHPEHLANLVNLGSDKRVANNGKCKMNNDIVIQMLKRASNRKNNKILKVL